MKINLYVSNFSRRKIGEMEIDEECYGFLIRKLRGTYRETGTTTKGIKYINFKPLGYENPKWKTQKITD